MKQYKPRQRLSIAILNRVATGFVLCYWGLGLCLNKQKITHSRRSGNGWFGAFVATDALLATLLLNLYFFSYMEKALHRTVTRLAPPGDTGVER